MKKLIVILAVLALAMPSMAAVTLTGSGTGVTATVGYSYDGAGSRPRAFALRLQASAGTITAVTKVKTADGVSTAASPGFGIYPGTIGIDSTGTVTSYGTPVEPATLPGASGTGIGTNAVIVAMGSLYVGDANKPLNAANLLTVTCSTACTLTVSAETTNRGGVVGEDANPITVASLPITVPGAGGTDCVKSTAPFYADWVAFGKPSCWCFQRNPRGDADGAAQGGSKTGYQYVSTNDLNVLVAAWNIYEPTRGTGIGSGVNNGTRWICADFDHAAQGGSKTGYQRVSTNDLNALTAGWNIYEPTRGAGVPTGAWTNAPSPTSVSAADPANYNTRY